MKYFLLFLSVPFFLFSQNQTMGLFKYDAETMPGYTLFSPNQNTYLIDNCGKLVHSWISNYNTGGSLYLLEDGSLLRTCRMQSVVFSGGGIGGRVEKYDWDNNLIWSYNFHNNTYHHHHDIEPLPNGNILVLCWEYKTLNQAINSGRNPNSLPDNELWSTYIIEAKPIGTDSIEIVWEWHLWDHLIQEFDSTKLNYGDVSLNPQLLNINFFKGNGKKDWLHCNSIAYNNELDQIIISSRALSEVYIIDHSTTTSEAASNNGGNSGKGGDFLFRWGNPLAYDQGTSIDQKLFGQHDAYWIDSGYLDEGAIMIFNNGQGRSYSSVDVINPQIDQNGFYLLSNNIFLPDTLSWTYTSDNPLDFYSSYISGSRRLKNGNTLICDGAHGTFFEVDYFGNVLWRYVNPVVNTGPLSQGDIIPLTQNGWGNPVFRCTKYDLDYPAFQGKDLIPSSVLELNPLPSGCYMPVNIDFDKLKNERQLLYIIDIFGREVKEKYNVPLFYIYDDGYIEKKIIIN